MQTIQFTDLVLLVGTNPLPNYVAAKYFLDNGIDGRQVKRVWLVYTARTEDKKNGLQSFFQSSSEYRHIEFEPVAIDDESDPRGIQQAIEKLIMGEINENDPDEHVHLNYTGGTKVMGIHVYRTLERKLARDKRCSFSYLSASRFHLVDDEKGFITGDLRREEKLKLGFDDLMKLHRLNRYQEQGSRSTFGEDAFQEATRLFGQLIENGNPHNFYDDYKAQDQNGNSVQTILNNISEQLKRSGRANIQNKTINPKGGLLAEIFQALPERLTDEDGNVQIASSAENFIEIVGYLNGKWLEDYVYQALKAHYSTNPHITASKNWAIQGSGWGSTYFEIDVLLMFGYQLIGISCTTEKSDLKNKTEIKKRGFEIILRTRQIGGDEARAILITLGDWELVDVLNKELKWETAATDSIMVLGKEDLKAQNLAKTIDRFIGIED